MLLGLDRHTIRVVDALVVVWVVLWLAIGLYAFAEVRRLRELGDGAVAAGVALHRTADGLGALRTLPFVGEEIAELERRVDEGAARAERAGRQAREGVDRLAVLLGLVVALGPTAPLAAVYLPSRLAWSRDRRAVRKALAAAGPSVALDTYLARRAAASHPFEGQRYVLLQGDHGTRALADAELQRLGLRRPESRAA
jgi:hypothetical protein